MKAGTYSYKDRCYKNVFQLFPRLPLFSIRENQSQNRRGKNKKKKQNRVLNVGILKNHFLATPLINSTLNQ